MADEKTVEKTVEKKAVAEEKAVEHGYLGATACKICHKKETKGAQYTKWLASPHAHAYQTLLTDESKKICKKLGIKEAPEAAGKCLKCHVTAYGVKAELLGKKYDKTEGVSCESCHGPAADWKKPHMKDPETAAKLGMIKPDDEKMCMGCHNEESPTYKPFKYKEKLAAIAHPNPMKADKK
ncbi:MAG: cytochrome c family protein [Candidatus Eisenbacteria sp.]|nr:cytochrome c family protein [Candidatus Eisenbacteria bacterium]